MMVPKVRDSSRILSAFIGGCAFSRDGISRSDALPGASTKPGLTGGSSDGTVGITGGKGIFGKTELGAGTSIGTGAPMGADTNGVVPPAGMLVETPSPRRDCTIGGVIF